MKRIVAILVVVALVAVAFGARSSDAAGDPLRRAWLVREAAGQAAEADAALAAAEELMRAGTRAAARGQAAVLAGDGDPQAAMSGAAAQFEAAANHVAEARRRLAELAWTLRALDPEAAPPELTSAAHDPVAIAAQWRATALPLDRQADLRHAADATLAALAIALAALDDDDPAAALAAVADAQESLDRVRAVKDELSTLPVWIDTVTAMLEATGDIARAAEAGDAEALAAARASYESAAADASRADRALVIALGEAAAGITGPASATSAAALDAVAAARAAVAGLSILP